MISPSVTRAAPPRRLAYAELISGSQTTTNTGTETDLSTPLTITFTAGVKSVLLKANFPVVTHSVAGGTVLFYVTDSSNNAVARGVGDAGAAAGAMSVNIESRELALTPGTSYTYKVRWNIVTAGTGSLFHNTGANGCWMKAVEVQT
jgi:carbon monoxide dehydrogenase subunit G